LSERVNGIGKLRRRLVVVIDGETVYSNNKFCEAL
jgi:hypothetical protein